MVAILGEGAASRLSTTSVDNSNGSKESVPSVVPEALYGDRVQRSIQSREQWRVDEID